MDRVIITLGDFLKNAGIVGMKYLLDISEAEEDSDYGITPDEQGIWLDRNFALQADWTDLYFNTCVKYFGKNTVYQGVLDRIERCLTKIREDKWNPGREDKDDLKFITEKLLSNSYQNGFNIIKEKVENPEVYLELKKNKLSDKFESDVLRKRLEELQQFLTQPLCRETFIMKSIIYNYINRFWDGKCFLLRANAKKDMRAVFEKDFSEPFHKYLEGEHKKAKDTCIDCGNGITGKEKISIAFMKEMADDLTRKRSAFWNCQVDAFLCPVCAFVYALSPLGFQMYANKFVFMNLNENISVLVDVNGKKRGNGLKEKGEEENYTVWFARILNKVLSDKVKELNNVQVILRGTRAEDNYMFSIIGRDALQILKQEKVQKALKYLEQHPYVKLSNEFVNVHESVVMNILQYHKQYSLLNQILKESLENTGVIPTAYWVFVVQLCTSIEKRMEVNVGSISEELEQSQQGIEEKLSKAKEGIFMSRIKMRDAGYKLRKEILLAKKAENDECMRGTIYQLLNALSVRNEGKFMDIVIRLYSSTKLPMADGFVYMLGNKEKFSEYGYSFILGLKGSYTDSKDSKSEDTKQSQDESGEENYMTRDGLTFTMVFLAESANYGEGIGNITTLKKMTRGDFQQYSYISRQAMRYNIVKQLKWDNTPVDGKSGVVQFAPSATIEDYPEIDLFGYMKTTSKADDKKGGASTRSAVVRLSNAISLEPYQSDLEFLTNMGLAQRQNLENGIAQSEIHRSYYSYTISIDLDRIGVDVEIEVSQEEKASRVKELLDTVQYLYRDIRGRRENLSPLFIIGGRYKRKNPFFENIVSVKANKIGVATLKEIVEDSEELKEYTYTGITSGIFDNEKDVKEKLKAESVGNVFKHLKEEMDAYYEGN